MTLDLVLTDATDAVRQAWKAAAFPDNSIDLMTLREHSVRWRLPR
jgi:hypothetical protein